MNTTNTPSPKQSLTDLDQAAKQIVVEAPPRVGLMQYIFFAIGLIWLAVAYFGAEKFIQGRVQAEISALSDREQLHAQTIANLIDQNLHELSSMAATISRQQDVKTTAITFSARDRDFAGKDVSQNYETLINEDQLFAINSYFSEICERLKIDQIFMLNRMGLMIASHHWQSNASGIGDYYHAREYFQNAMKLGESKQFAVGRARAIPGFFFSARVRNENGAQGVVVVRQTMDKFQPLLARAGGETIVMDQAGIVVASSLDGVLLYHAGKAFGEPPSGKELQDNYRLDKVYNLDRLEPPARADQFWKLDGKSQLVLESVVPIANFRVVRLAPLAAVEQLKLTMNYIAWIVVGAGLLILFVIERSMDYSRRRRLHNLALANANEELSKMNQHLYEMATTDAMTGAKNRRFFMERLGEEVSRFHRHPGSLAMLMLDIDFFKKVNDTYGHPMGDEAIKNLARMAQTGVRAQDVVGRLGGEEFAIILPDTDAEQALHMAERLRQVVEVTETEHEGVRIKYTVSVGVAQMRADMDIEKIMKEADNALYVAKKTGRNRVIVATENMEMPS